MPAHCATERRPLDTIRLRRIFGIGDASPNAAPNLNRISPDDRREEPPKFACDEVVRLPERKARTPKGPQGAERWLQGCKSAAGLLCHFTVSEGSDPEKSLAVLSYSYLLPIPFLLCRRIARPNAGHWIQYAYGAFSE